jgi:pyruvate dehydrogenase (quinone)
MMLGELLTLRQRHLPVKVVVFNNGALSFVELEMKAAAGRRVVEALPRA